MRTDTCSRPKPRRVVLRRSSSSASSSFQLPQLIVADTRRAMAPAAVVFFGDPSRELDVAAVTGTAGKTTTAYLVHEILRAAGRRPGLLTNIERRVGDEARPAALNTPESIDLQRLFREMVDAGNTACVMEATSHASALGRLDGVRFAVLVFTNLAHEHLDFHGSMEEYFQAKRRLFAQAEHAVVNVGDEWGRRLAEDLPRAITFDASSDVLDAELGLHGRFNLENALGAAAAARALGVAEDSIREGIERVRGVPGRLEFVEEGQPFSVIVDYSHKPASLERVLLAARELARGRVLCVFGCGGDRDREKRPLMGRIASELADVAIVTSDNPRTEDPVAIIAEVVAGAPELDVEPDRRRAIARALEAGPRRRRRADRGQGPRAGSGDRGSEAPVRRSRGRARAVARVAARVIPLSLEHVAELATGELTPAVWADEITGVQVDSRRIAEGDLFVALGDGADFRRHAFARGAAATFVPDDPHAALAALAGAVRDRSAARFVAITGSMGKTSTKDILAAICAGQARTVAAERSYNNEIGVPLTLCRVEADTELCILELSMRGFGQIAALCAFARPEIGVITNIAPVHLEQVARSRASSVRRASSSRRCRPAAPRSSRRASPLRATTSMSSASART